MSSFDVILELEIVRESSSPQKLFQQFDRVSKLFESRRVPQHEFEEVKEAIFTKLKRLETLKRSLHSEKI
jgi:hypothetical protein